MSPVMSEPLAMLNVSAGSGLAGSSHSFVLLSALRPIERLSIVKLLVPLNVTV